jgi:hypothetical protein
VVNTKINLAAATAFVRKHVEYKRPVMLTGNHKGTRHTLEVGWLIIEQQWYTEKK